MDPGLALRAQTVGMEEIKALIALVSKEAFAEFAAAAVRSISMRNAHIPTTEIVEIIE